MTKRTSFLMRFLALSMALVMFASGSNLGLVLQAFASEGPTVVKDGELMANTYSTLSEAEKELLKSGMLGGGETTVTELPKAEELITVDAEAKTVTAATKDGWAPVSAVLKDGTYEEEIALVGGVGSFKYDGLVYSIEVAYSLDTTIAAAAQEAMLKAPAQLKQGLKNLADAKAQDVNLGKMVDNIEAIEDIANRLGADSITAELEPLKAEIAQYGKLHLQVLNGNALNLEYLMTKGTTEYKPVLVETYEHLAAIYNILNENVEKADEEEKMLWSYVGPDLKDTADGLAAPATADWTLPELSNVNYAELEAMLANVGEMKADVQETLNVAKDTRIVYSNNAKQITVYVKLQTASYENGDNSVQYKNQHVVKDSWAVGKTDSHEEIVAKINARVDLEKVTAGWGADYVAANYQEPKINDKVMEDGTYTITYDLNTYKVTDHTGTNERHHGYVVYLEKYPVDGFVYDYFIDGEKKLQDTTYTIEKDTTITRASVKEYDAYKLYEVIGDNSGSKNVKAILTSGAVLGDNPTILVHRPDEDQSVNLAADVLTATSWKSDYNSLMWVPYSYGADADHQDNLFGSSNTAAWTGKEATVVFKLDLTNYTGKVQGTIDLAVQLKKEAADQMELMNGLNSYESTIGQINRTILDILQDMVAESNIAGSMKMDFDKAINGIRDNCLDASKNLTLYKYLREYEESNLVYYYQNDKQIKDEINKLAPYITLLCGTTAKQNALSEMIESNETLADLAAQAGVDIAALPQDLAKVEGKLNEAKEVKLHNAAISLENEAALATLCEALKSKDKVDDAKKVATPYLLQPVGASQFNRIIVELTKADGTRAQIVRTFENGVVTDADIEGIRKEITDKGNDEFFYVKDVVEDINLDSFVGELKMTQRVYINYYAKTFKVNFVEGNTTITVDVDGANLYVKPVEHADLAYAYRYYVDGEEIAKDKFIDTFADRNFFKAFIQGDKKVVCEAYNIANENLVNAMKHHVVETDAQGNIIGITANLMGGVGYMQLAEDFIGGGYDYIELNGKEFLNGKVVTIQALLDAVLSSPEFTSANLIALNNAGKGKMITLDMLIKQGDAAEHKVPYTLNMEALPSQFVTMANGLEAVKNYFSFEAKDGVLSVEVDVPDSIYEIYLTALLATSNLDKSDVNAMNQQIAFQFLNDYLDLIVNDSEISIETYENTANMLRKEFSDLTNKYNGSFNWDKYGKYYNAVVKAVKGSVRTIDAEKMTIDLDATDTTINSVMNAFGFDLGAAGDLATIKEMEAGGKLVTKIVVTMADADRDFEAIVVDLHRTGAAKQTLKRIYDFTDNLPKRAAELGGETAIMLLDDVDGDLVISQSGIIDLNGHTINGGIKFSGRKLIVTDSSLNTYSGAGVTGAVEGDVVTLAGTYGTVTEKMKSWLPDGYYFDENGTVRNALYNYVNGNIVVDTDKLFDENYVTGYLPAVQYMATDIAINFILNYYTASSLTIEGNDIYAISFDDIVGILGTDSNRDKVEQIIDDMLAMVRFDGGAAGGEGGIDDFINMVIEDLLDIEKIRNAIANGTAIGDYKITTGAWKVDVKRVAEGNYLTVGLVNNTELAKSTNMSLSFQGTNKDRTLRYLDELGRVVQDDTYLKIDLDQPYRDVKNLVLAGGIEGRLSLDFSHNCDYNRLMASILAYFVPELTDELVKDGCIMELNEVMSKITIGDFVTAMQNAVDAFDGKYGEQLEKIDFAAIAKRLKLNLSEVRIDALNSLYERFINVSGRILARIDASKYAASTPLDRLFNDGVAEVDLDSQRDYNADAFFRSYGIDVTLKPSKLSLKIKMATKCDGIWGDANRDGKVNSRDVLLILQYRAGYLDRNNLYNEIHLCVCDVNCDDKINSRDVQLILQKRAGKIEKLPVEE